MLLTAAQCRSARAYLGWTAGDVAKAAGVGIMTVKRLEGGQPMQDSSVSKIMQAFTAAGISFIAAGEASTDGGEGFRVTCAQPSGGPPQSS
ncbi:XRE family transcriptional regulator [Sphingomonas sp. ABOLG]|uniref:XRE family transcriptional regulator n=1 Tax=Sphingomonas sp. ABOLG TaxID=1985880 RepID=UPI000F7DF207|nr:XRE family transcriptional regulator [Sphingomonas sp. ABOLG]